MAGLTVPLITRSSCHPPCHWPITFWSASALHTSSGSILYDVGVREEHITSFKAPIWSFLLSYIISSSCFSTREASRGLSAQCTKNSSQQLFLQSDWIRDESWSRQEEEMQGVPQSWQNWMIKALGNPRFILKFHPIYDSSHYCHSDGALSQMCRTLPKLALQHHTACLYFQTTQIGLYVCHVREEAVHKHSQR